MGVSIFSDLEKKLDEHLKSAEESRDRSRELTYNFKIGGLFHVQVGTFVGCCIDRAYSHADYGYGSSHELAEAIKAYFKRKEIRRVVVGDLLKQEDVTAELNE